MKQKYIAPTTEVAHIELCSMLTASPTVNIHTKKPGVGADQSLSNERRDNWGNIWNE